MPEVVQDASWNRVNNIGNLGNGISRAVDLYNMFKPGGTEDQRRQMMQIAQQQFEQSKLTNAANIGLTNAQASQVAHNNALIDQNTGLTEQQKLAAKQANIEEQYKFGGNVSKSQYQGALSGGWTPNSRASTTAPLQEQQTPLAPIGADASQPAGKPSNPDSSSTPPTSTPDQSQQSPGTTATSVDAAPKAHKPVVIPTDSTLGGSQSPTEPANAPTDVPNVPGAVQGSGLSNVPAPTSTPVVQVASPVSSNSTVSQGQVVPNQQSPAPAQGTATPPLSQPSPGLLPVGGTQQTQQAQPASQGFPPLSQVPAAPAAPVYGSVPYNQLPPQTQQAILAHLRETQQQSPYWHPGQTLANESDAAESYNQVWGARQFGPLNQMPVKENLPHTVTVLPSQAIKNGSVNPVDAADLETIDRQKTMGMMGNMMGSSGTMRMVPDLETGGMKMEPIPTADQIIPKLGITRGALKDVTDGLDAYNNGKSKELFEGTVFPAFRAVQNLAGQTNTNNFSDTDLLSNSLRIANPGATAKQATVEEAKANPGWIDWMGREAYGHFTNQGALTPEDRQHILEGAANGYKGYLDSYNNDRLKVFNQAKAKSSLDDNSLSQVLFGGPVIMPDISKTGNTQANSETQNSKISLPPDYRVGHDPKTGKVYAVSPDGKKEDIEKYSKNSIPQNSKKPFVPPKNNSVNAIEG